MFEKPARWGQVAARDEMQRRLRACGIRWRPLRYHKRPRLAGTLPRWVPIALLGLLLFAVGATYEARLNDLRKLGDVLRRMR